MTAPRPTFGRVDAIKALVALLSVSDEMDGIQVVDAWQEQLAEHEAAWCGDIIGTIEQGSYTSGLRTDDRDEFEIPVHIAASDSANQPESMDARERCEHFMNGVRLTVATAKKLDGVPGLMFVVNAGADGPDPEAVADPPGWVAFGTVRIGVRIQMR